jgi:hypothetical protein
MKLSSTHTCAELEVSSSTFNEIKQKLVEGGYIEPDSKWIDTHGIALVEQEREREPGPDEYLCPTCQQIAHY